MMLNRFETLQRPIFYASLALYPFILFGLVQLAARVAQPLPVPGSDETPICVAGFLGVTGAYLMVVFGTFGWVRRRLVKRELECVEGMLARCEERPSEEGVRQLVQARNGVAGHCTAMQLLEIDRRLGEVAPGIDPTPWDDPVGGNPR